MIRLDKYLCEMEAGTRSEVKAFIKKGRVTVNGETAKSPEQKVDETKDTVTLDGHSFSYQKYFYYMLHKPAGVVTAVRDHHDQTVLDLLVDAPGKDLSPVGRLDKDTEGLLLLTNDGELAHRLQHPRYGVLKTYLAQIPGPVPRDLGKRLRQGIELEDGMVAVDSFKVVDSQPGKALVEVVLHEGRKHIVRRMLAEVGHPVLSLVRTQVGPIRLGDTKSGRWRALTASEVGALYKAADL